MKYHVGVILVSMVIGTNFAAADQIGDALYQQQQNLANQMDLNAQRSGRRQDSIAAQQFRQNIDSQHQAAQQRDQAFQQLNDAITKMVGGSGSNSSGADDQ
jgi:capsule polysaccharide export protein KpsE/RkpR